MKAELPAGELFPRVGFMVTNLELPSRAVVRFYNKRGTFWQHVAKDRGAAAAKPAANQERHRIERSELIWRGEVLAAKLAGG